MTSNAYERLFCQGCSRNTQHDILFSDDSTEFEIDDDAPPFNADWRWQLLACRGCETRCCRAGWKVEPNDDWVWTIYPERKKERKGVISPFFLPKPIFDLYSQTIRAFNANARTLAAAGLRATVEAICIHEEVKGRDLEKKIDSLAEAGKLTKDSASYLHEHRYLGNAAVHNMTAPPTEQFVLALDILEHLMKSLYEIPSRAKKLEKMRNAPK